MTDSPTNPTLDPLCRYGHGLLEAAYPAIDIPHWNVVSVAENPDGGDDDWHSRFPMLMYRCPRCGYIEFFYGIRDGLMPLTPVGPP